MYKKALLLLCASIPSFMISLDANIVSVSLSSIGHALHADFTAIEWVISAYTLTFASLLMPAGAFADRFGRKRLLVIGLALFTIASWACGAASSVLVLNVARAIQGAGAAIQLSAALAILSHGFQGTERAKAFAFWGSVIGIAVMLGPVAGGIMTQTLGWQWSFYVNVPIGLIMIALTLRTVDESRDPLSARIDIAGVLTFSGFLSLLTWALISGNRVGWTNESVIVKGVVAVALLLLFGVIEARQARPMVDLQNFFRPTFLGANTAAIAYAFTFLTMLTYLPLFFQTVLGYASLAAGLLMLPLATPLFAVPKVISRYFDHRVSGRAMLTVGLLFVGVGLSFTALLIPDLRYVAIAPPMLIASIGAGILNGQAPKVGMTVIPVERAGMASGIAGTMRFSGIVIGFAALGAVFYEGISDFVRNQADAVFDAPAQLELVHAIASGNTSAIAAAVEGHQALSALVQPAMVHGYVLLFAAAALCAFVAAAIAWVLISPEETAPHVAPERVELLID